MVPWSEVVRLDKSPLKPAAGGGSPGFNISKWSDIIAFEGAVGTIDRNWNQVVKIKQVPLTGDPDSEKGGYGISKWSDIIAFEGTVGTINRNWNQVLKIWQVPLTGDPDSKKGGYGISKWSDIIAFEGTVTKIDVDWSDIINLDERINVDLTELIDFDSAGLREKITEAVQDAIDDREIDTQTTSWRDTHSQYMKPSG